MFGNNNDEKIPIFLGEWYKYLALEVELVNEKSFLSIRETLTRIGVCSSRDNKLYQSCHVLTKKGKIYIVHFKEMFALDGRPVNISEEDIGRRNTIACLLQEWGLLNVVDVEMVRKNRVPVTSLKIIKYKDAHEYELIPKYQIGGRKEEYELNGK